jgi:hypothetical protein
MTEKLTGLNNRKLKSELVERVGETANETMLKRPKANPLPGPIENSSPYGFKLVQPPGRFNLIDHQQL